jgi:hypothetical protein
LYAVKPSIRGNKGRDGRVRAIPVGAINVAWETGRDVGLLDGLVVAVGADIISRDHKEATGKVGAIMSSDGIATREGWVCSEGVDDVGVVRAVISLTRPIFGE